MWFCGDDFGFKTFQQYFYERQIEIKGYVRENFEISGFMNNSTNSLDGNTVSRFCNMLVGAITDKKVFPKMIDVVPDDDIVNFNGHTGDNWSKDMGRI